MPESPLWVGWVLLARILALNVRLSVEAERTGLISLRSARQCLLRRSEGDTLATALNRQLCAADSTGQRNTLVKTLGRCSKV